MKIVVLSGTTAADGTLTMNASEQVVGYVEKIVMDYIDADTGADLTITCVDIMVEPILTITDAGTTDLVKYPRVAPVTTANGAITNSYTRLFVSGKFRCVVAQGGNAKAIKLVFYLSDE
jgi:hypothetical protein